MEETVSTVYRGSAGETVKTVSQNRVAVTPG